MLSGEKKAKDRVNRFHASMFSITEQRRSRNRLSLTGKKYIILPTIKFSSAEKGTAASGVSIFELLGRKKNHSIASKDDLVTSNYIFHNIISVKKLFLSLAN